MTSINFNVAATTALRTLQQTNSALETSQNRVSTGLKIGEAKDNAAYWSISTTLKSDNKSLSTVKDALSLGAATIDTAYQGLNKTKEVLDEIKSKITAASQAGVDRKAIQSEITQLQDQLKSIAQASSFSGENMLSVNSGVASYTAVKNVVSGVQKDSAGNFTINTIAVDGSSFALIDANASSEAILDAGKSGNALLGGLAAAGTATVGTSTAGKSQQAAAYTYAAGTGLNADPTAETLTVAFTIDQASVSFTLTDSAKFDTLAHLVTNLNIQFGGRATASDNGGTLLVTSNTAGAGSVADLTAVTYTTPAATAATVTGLTLGGETSTNGTASTVAVTQTASFGGLITLDSNDSIAFQLELNGATAKTITVTKDTVKAALGTTNGNIATAGQYATVLNQAFQDAGVTDVTATVTGSQITLTSSVAGAGGSIRLADVEAKKGTSVLDIDVTSASTIQLATFLNAVSKASDGVTAAAASLGAVSSRIELQNTFVNTLIDTIDKGVSNLIDADLSEESTKLQALQTKQQLGIQALSIANSSTQNILSLFRS